MPNLPLNDKTFYTGTGKGLNDLIKTLDVVTTALNKTVESATKANEALSLEIKTNPKEKAEDYKLLNTQLTKFKDNTKAIAEGNKAIIKLDQEKAVLDQKLSKAAQEKIKTEQQQLKLSTQQKKETERLTKAEEKQRKELEKQNSSYQKLNKRLGEARKKAKDIGATYGTTSKQFRKAAVEVLNLDSKIKKIDKSLGLSQREVGNYQKAFKGATGALLGFAAGALSLRAAFSVIKNGIATYVEFGKQVSKVAAISGASGDDLKALTAQAQALGEATEKTASEVSSLQLELAKLGFDPKQIQNATDSILDLSTAIDADLAQSATVVGSTLRAYGLEANETQRVTDVMAAAFSKSSLDINKFQTAMASVAPVAKKFGFSVEDTTALLAQLTDAGFDASSAGTATRKILLNLADANGKLAKSLGSPVESLEDLLQGLAKLNDEGTDLGEALQLTDVRSVAAFSTFLEGVDKTRKLAKELEGAKGAAKIMAEIMRDNLSGDTDKANSAVEGLSINLGKRLDPALRRATQGFARLIGRLNEVAKTKASDELRKIKIELNAELNVLKKGNITNKQRGELIGIINIKYKDYLPNLLSEKSTLEDIELAQKGANSELLRKISIQAKAEALEDQVKKIQELRKKQFLEERQQEKELEEIRESGLEASIRRIRRTDAANRHGIAANIARREAEEAEIELELLKISLADLSLDLIEEETIATEDGTDAVIKYTEAIERLQFAASKGIEIKQFPDLRTDFEKRIDEIFAKGAQKSKERNNKLIEEAKERQQIIEDLESQHYESLLSIGFNFANKKAAQDKTISNTELQTIISNNAQIEAAYQQLADTLIDIGNQILQSQLDNINASISAKDQEIDEINQSLNRELQLLLAGHSNEFDAEKEKLEKLQAERDKDIKEREKIQKQQETINTLIQISELATAVASIISSAVGELGWAGVVVGLAAAAAAIVGFSTYKSEAESAASAEDGGMFTKKGTHIEKGNRHSQGGNKYSSVEFEKDEIHSIFSRNASKKHGSLIENFTNIVNDPSFNGRNLSPDETEMYNYSISQLPPTNTIINNNNSELLSELKHMNMLLSTQKIPFLDAKGKFKLYDNQGSIKKIEM